MVDLLWNGWSSLEWFLIQMKDQSDERASIVGSLASADSCVFSKASGVSSPASLTPKWKDAVFFPRAHSPS